MRTIATIYIRLCESIAAIFISEFEILLQFIFVYVKYCRILDNLHRAS